MCFSGKNKFSKNPTIHISSMRGILYQNVKSSETNKLEKKTALVRKLHTFYICSLKS